MALRKVEEEQVNAASLHEELGQATQQVAAARLVTFKQGAEQLTAYRAQLASWMAEAEDQRLQRAEAEDKARLLRAELDRARQQACPPPHCPARGIRTLRLFGGTSLLARLLPARVI